MNLSQERHDWDELIAGAAARLGRLALRNVTLAPFTTFRVGGAAALFAVVRTPSELDAIATVVRELALPTLCIGQGSNLLVADNGFAGLALLLRGEFTESTIDDSTVVAAGGAAKLPVLARLTAAAGLRGLEWAVGVPGSIGGGVAMNAGGHGSDMRSCLTQARILDLRAGTTRAWTVDELAMGYRSSAVRAEWVVVSAEFALTRGDRESAETEIAEIVRWRREHQPGGANCGSVFANPDGDSAGRLIDAAGLRGWRIGSAAVSEKHANFIQADQTGQAADIRALIDYVRATVHERFGVDLRPEVRMIGFEPSAHGASTSSGLDIGRGEGAP